MTPQELDKMIQQMTDQEFSAFISNIPDDISGIFVMRRGLLKLFNDLDYFNAVKNALRGQIIGDIYHEK